MASRWSFGQLPGNRFFFSHFQKCFQETLVFSSSVWICFCYLKMCCCFNQKPTRCHLSREQQSRTYITMWKKNCLFLLVCVCFLKHWSISFANPWLFVFLESLKMPNWQQKQGPSAGRGWCLFWSCCSIRRSFGVHRHWYLHFSTSWAGNGAPITEPWSLLFCSRLCKAWKCGLLCLCFVAMSCSLACLLQLNFLIRGEGWEFVMICFPLKQQDFYMMHSFSCVKTLSGRVLRIARKDDTCPKTGLICRTRVFSRAIIIL